LCRAERPQKGRLREFFQWNVDIIGVDDVLADAEVIFTAVDYLRKVGLGPRDVQVKISSRKWLAAGLRNIGVPEGKLDSLYLLLDKHAKLPEEVFKEELSKQISDKVIADKIIKLMGSTAIVEACDILGLNPNMDCVQELAQLCNHLKTMGIWQYCDLCPSIVRGLAYYTGIVFEVHQLMGDLRAICGGGRFDNLLKDFGGPSIPATGFGMGDCILEILLREKGLLDKKLSSKQLDYFVVYVDKKYQGEAIQVTTQLRSKGKGTNFSYKGGNLGKQLKQASAQNAARCIIIGQEIEAGQVVVKDMATGEQETVKKEDFFKTL
jgi:histidyl-tRNA synthetase